MVGPDLGKTLFRGIVVFHVFNHRACQHCFPPTLPTLSLTSTVDRSPPLSPLHITQNGRHPTPDTRHHTQRCAGVCVTTPDTTPIPSPQPSVVPRHASVNSPHPTPHPPDTRHHTLRCASVPVTSHWRTPSTSIPLLLPCVFIHSRPVFGMRHLFRPLSFHGGRRRRLRRCRALRHH